MANIGIDLGTTHSLVACVLGGEARCFLDDDERVLLPSAVRIGDDGVPKSVGYPALVAAGEPDGTTFTSFKRYMGRSSAEVREEAEQFGYQLVDPDDAEGVARFQCGPTQVTPVEMSSLILRLLHARAEECLFGRPGGAVITVPAYFDDAQRQATRDAARIAGIEVLRLLNEPTAAALAYGLNESASGQRVAVYDLGGGTFDISVLELDDGIFQVLSTAGDTRLGGDDFDQALARVVLHQAGITSPTGDGFTVVVQAAERAKRALTDTGETVIDVEVDGQHIQAGIDRTSFENLIRPIVMRTQEAGQQALTDAGLTANEIDQVVLVGGSTRVPLVREVVGQFFGQAPNCDLDPDQVVAMGAAMQADILTGESTLADDMLLLDVVPLSLGIEVMGGVVERLIPRCSTIPASATQQFTTHVDGQTGVDIHVLQGEREMVGDNRSLARFRLTGLPDMPAGGPRITVQFMVDADGILRVSASEDHTGTTASLDVQPTYGLSDEEIENMIEDAIDHAEEDIEERLLIDVQVEANTIIRHLRTAMERDGDLMQGEEEAQFQAVISELEEAMAGTERQRVFDLSKKLDEVTAAFAQRRIERDLERAITGRSTDNVADKLGL